MKQKLKKFIKFIRKICFHLFNIIYYPCLRSVYYPRVKKIPRSTQIFLMTRLDFGTYLFLLHYAACWQRDRGPVCLVVLTSKSLLVQRLAKLICPEVELICPAVRFNDWLGRLFGYENIQFFTLNPLYCRFAARWPYAIWIYDQPIDYDLTESVSNYIPYFDENMNSLPLHGKPEFLKAYLNAREILDYRIPVFKDMIRLHYKRHPSHPLSSVTEANYNLREKLKISEKYVVLNINCKDYGNKVQNIRRIAHPERYNLLIDFLISQNYSVVIQGRSEQPRFAERKGLIDYSKSKYASVENDLILFSGCDFGVLTKTGAEVFGTVCNIPVLGLNYVELSSMQPNSRFRFFPKFIWDTQRSGIVPWEEVLQSPAFFHIGKRAYATAWEYIELEEQELLDAAQEFLGLLPRQEKDWTEYTEKQKTFKKLLNPLHLDLHLIKGVPSEAYLNSTRFFQVLSNKQGEREQPSNLRF